MGLIFKLDSRSVSVAPFLKLRGYGRLLLLASIVLGFSVGTARSYVLDANELVDDVKNVSRETSKPFNEIIELTKSVETANKIKQQTRSSFFSSSSTAGNLCTSLLNTQDTHSSKTLAVRTQRPVGKVAALGLLLGARFALAPPVQHNRAIINEPDILLECQVVNADDKDAPVRSARAIAEYRQCQKNLVLDRIASAR
jgi:hypothetical protein